jgi:hypothetical protein
MNNLELRKSGYVVLLYEFQIEFVFAPLRGLAVNPFSALSACGTDGRIP